MLTDQVPGNVQGVLDRLAGPEASFVTGLVDAAALDRPVIIDSASVMAAVWPYTWLLGRIGTGGIKLTSAGYLPPQVVLAAVSELGWEKEWPGAHNREYHTLPVLELRLSARRMGLVRTHKGVLLRTALGTRLGYDPGQLWWYIAGRLPEARSDAERDAGLLLLLAVASGTPLDMQSADDLVRRGMMALGWRDATTKLALGQWQAFEAARGTWECLRRLGAIPETQFGQPPSPPRPAAAALARAALRGPAF
ncbi:MAG TPA: hypothetical protein VH641_07660 [Streptosporangiaceae bacterium]|jgi:hypothetical protein